MARDTDSLQHHEDRRAKMKADYKQETEKRAQAEAQQQVMDAERDRVTRESEIKYLEQQVGLVKSTDTRDMLLDRIRKMREPPPPEPEPPPLSPALQERLEQEQAAGRAAVARYEAETERNQEAQRAAEAEERKRLGTMDTVYIPNPDKSEQYPAVNATLGKKK